MRRIKKLLRHPIFLETLSKINALEKDRIFCRHDLEHLLAVARIGCIINMKKMLFSDKQRDNIVNNISEELIYAAALLHDLGRAQQYEEGVPHEKTSALIAGQIMADCDFDDDEIEVISEAILSHKDRASAKNSLGELLYEADKASRMCFACEALDECNWSDEDKNTTIIY